MEDIYVWEGRALVPLYGDEEHDRFAKFREVSAVHPCLGIPVPLCASACQHEPVPVRLY